ncbi:MAG: formate/nitrite transporter family protein, partial [Duodenibacillus sp.]|nr:formate/nitrite transporter family protein [Duodenibacillus sp.]
MTTENQPAPSACPLLDAAAGGGASRMAQNAWAVFALAILAGAYIALGGVLAIRCGTGLEWAQWGGMGKFVFAAVFPLGIVLVVICGADLFTGDCM